MPAYVKFQKFVAKLGDGNVDLDGHTIAVYLSNTAPNVATAAVKADVPEIATGNGYSGPIDINAAYAQVGGVGSLTSNASAVVTASGGSVGPFRYAVLWDSTANVLIGYWDYGSAVTLNDTNTFTINFPAAIFTIQ